MKKYPFFLFFVSAIFGSFLSKTNIWWIGPVLSLGAAVLIFAKRDILISLSIFFMGLSFMLSPVTIPDGIHFITGRINQVSGNAVSLSDIKIHISHGWIRGGSAYVLLSKTNYSQKNPEISDLFMARIEKTDGKISAIDSFWTAWPGSFLDETMAWGAKVSNFIYDHFKRYVIAGADTLASVFLGRRDIPYDLKMMYNESGYAQIFAVSGANVWIIATITLIFISELVPMNYVKYPIVLAIIVFYGIITGFSIPTFRAVFTFGIYTIFKLLDRKQSLLNILGFVGLFEVLIDGSVIFDPSFQLSYSAVIGMIALIPILPEFKPRYVSQALNATIAANIGIMPFLILDFGKIYVASLPFNALVVPVLMTILMEGGLIFSLCAILEISFLEVIVGSGISPFVKALDWLAYFTIRLPLSTVEIPSKMTVFWITFSMLSTLILFALLHQQGNPDKYRKSSIDDLLP
ncbi:ComEC/Rec2 family competence protein [Athalassotoga sp.]|uniref:ComEC/Rec2 family competence protein n=1 Tax=Athalassotoga sp. TaxID=2022597 RepID=UPI003D024BDC